MLPTELFKELRSVARVALTRGGTADIYLGRDYTTRLLALQQKNLIAIKHVVGSLVDVTVTDAGYVALGQRSEAVQS